MKHYTHKELAHEIKTISGYFTYLEENRLSFHGREILYAVGIGIVDNSCCGVGGCRFIEVPGYILFWKGRVDEAGHALTEVSPITEDKDKREVKAILEDIYPYSQINFL